jgi:hypothetical protein
VTELERFLRNEFGVLDFILITQQVTLFYIAFIKRNK